MVRLFLLFLALPWWTYFFIAGGIVYLAEKEHQSALDVRAKREAALQSPAPEAVNLSDFRRATDISPVKEVTVTGWFNFDYNYHLIEETNTIETDSHHLYVLFGQSDTQETKVARAAIVLDDTEWEWFAENLNQFYDFEASQSQFQYTFNGFGRSNNGVGSHVSDVFSDEGLTKSPDFIFLSPFFKGREVALTASDTPPKTRLNGLIFAAVVALFGVARLMMHQGGSRPARKPAKVDAFADGPIVGAGPSAVRPQPAMSTAIPADSPLGRINQRRLAQETQQVQETQAQATVKAAPKPSVVDKLAVSAASIKRLPKSVLIVAVVVIFVLIQAGPTNSLFPLLFLVGFWAVMIAGISKLKEMARGFLSFGTAKKPTEDPYDRLFRQVHPGE
ncbi:MAG: hypothetical protein GY945_10325 [Rhodobacteraceae bacterium]|nr:hypothetical protein [Paracoccaceae bacterium]